LALGTLEIHVVEPMLTLRSAVAEEVHNASTVVPWAIVSTILVNGVLGLALLIALLFCLGDVTAALETPTGFPFIEIFAQATNSNAAATVMTCLILFLLIASGSGVMATASRLLWSFSRDNAVPFSGYISRVSLKEPSYSFQYLSKY
jgi:choline transport protein